VFRQITWPIGYKSFDGGATSARQLVVWSNDRMDGIVGRWRMGLGKVGKTIFKGSWCNGKLTKWQVIEMEWLMKKFLN
jgi:hypothetical protein